MMSEKKTSLPATAEIAESVAFSGRASIPLIVLCVFATVFPIALVGVPDNYDLMQHMRFAAAFHDAILSGDFIPRWSASDTYGFGGIGTRYYPPLAYFVLALTNIFTGSWYHSFWITTLAWALIGSLGIYKWLTEWTGNSAATIAAVVYAIIPYHTFQIYQAVLYSEFAASGILPFCFLFLTRLCKRNKWADAILFAITYSLLILTHIPTAIIATLCIGLYGIVIVDWKGLRNTALKVAAAVAMSGVATSFHLVKAITEVEWVKHNSPQFLGGDYYNYKTFLFPIYFFAPDERYVGRMLWHFDAMILLTILCFALAPVAWFAARDREAPAQNVKLKRAILLTGVFALFMLSAASSFLWDNVPILAKVQFSWRWLSIASLMAAASFGIAASFLMFKGNKLNRLAAYPILLFLIIVAMYSISQNIIPSIPLSKGSFDEKVANMYDEEACECWWPIWAKKSALEQRERVSAGERPVTIAEWDGLSRKFTVGPGMDSNARTATFYHPHWKARVNGQPVTVQAAEDGAITIPLPPESADVDLNFKEPRVSYVTQSISIVAWVGLIAGLFISYRSQRGQFAD
jgi:hypothetical protein